MKRWVLRCALVLALFVSVGLGTTGCMLWSKVQPTQITVEVRANRFLHIAAVPRQLPNGERPTKQLEALLDDVSRRAGGYTLIESVAGGWLPPGQTEVVREENDLLLVEGPPEMSIVLKARIAKDFQQQYPFVISIPVEAITLIQQTSASGAAPVGEKPAQTAPSKEEPAAAKK